MTRLKEVEKNVRSVVCTPDICSGSPRLDNTRLTCNNVVRAIAYEGVEGMRKTYLWPVFNEATLHNCVTYCAERRCITDRPLNFCCHCLLDTGRLEESDDESAAVWKFAQEILRQGVMKIEGLSSEKIQSIESEYENDNKEAEAVRKTLEYRIR